MYMFISFLRPWLLSPLDRSKISCGKDYSIFQVSNLPHKVDQLHSFRIYIQVFTWFMLGLIQFLGVAREIALKWLNCQVV